MSIDRRPTQEIQVIRRSRTPQKDRHGNTVYTYDEPVPVDVWVIAPRTREEPREQGRYDAIFTLWEIYAPLGTDIGPYDRVKLPDGTLTDVVGEVGVWANNPHAHRRRRARHEGVQFMVQRRAG